MSKEVEVTTPEVDKQVINNFRIMISSVDRSFKGIQDWWESLQTAESVYFPSFAALYDILATVALDGTIVGIMNKRIMQCTNKPMYFKDKTGKKIDVCDELACSAEFKRLRWERFNQLFWGRFGIEAIPGPEFKFNTIPLKHIDPIRKIITKDQWGTTGMSYENVWNIIVRGERDDFGLLTNCAPYAIWKKQNFADWAQYVEIFGQPLLIFTYDAYDEATKKNIDDIMRSIGAGSRVTIPKQLSLVPMDGKSSNGDGALQDKLRLACNEEMKIIILGVTETTTSSSSSGYAQSQTHLQQQSEVKQDDMDDELHFFNSKEWLAIQKSYGFPAEGEWCHEEEMDLDKVTKQVNIVKTVKSLGTPVDDDHIYTITGIPKPTNYNAMKKEIDNERKASLQNKLPQPPTPKDKKKKAIKDQKLTFWNKLSAFFD
jgi:hypothetical protein